MPNHITNLITVTGDADKVAAFRAAHVREIDGRPLFDFDTIIPKPQCVKDTSRDFNPTDHLATVGNAQVELYALALLRRGGHFTERARYPWIPSDVRTWDDVVTWLAAKYPTVDKWGRAALRCAADTGYPGWYEWSCANWGTKWGAYEYKERSHEPGRFVFEFQTAWSPPRPIFNKAAEIWPELTIDVEAIDEGGPEYVGRYHDAERTLEEVDKDLERYRRVYGREPDGDDAESAS